MKGRRTSYLVRWHSSPPSADSWEPRSQMTVDVLNLVEQYDNAHPMPKKAHRRTNAQRVCREIEYLLFPRTLTTIHESSTRGRSLSKLLLKLVPSFSHNIGTHHPRRGMVTRPLSITDAVCNAHRMKSASRIYTEIESAYQARHRAQLPNVVDECVPARISEAPSRLWFPLNHRCLKNTSM